MQTDYYLLALWCDVFSPKSNWPFFAAISQGKLMSNLLHTIICRSLAALLLLGFLSLIEYLGFRLFFHKCSSFYFLCWISFYSPLIFPAFSDSCTLFCPHLWDFQIHPPQFSLHITSTNHSLLLLDHYNSWQISSPFSKSFQHMLITFRSQ